MVTIPARDRDTPWSAADLPRMDGRTVIVTGASSGLGEVTAREFARVGARVVLAVRDVGKGERAAAAMVGSTEVRRLDLADLASVRAFADSWSGDVDILINNAGIMAVPEAETVDGFEMQIGTNHLGHFALTNLLLPHILDRVVTVSSLAQQLGRIHLDDLNWERRRYHRWRAYGQSKLANLLFTSELQRRLGDVGSEIRSLAAHPGYASTNLTDNLSRPLAWAAGVFGRISASSANLGAVPTLFAAVSDLPGDTWIGPAGRHGPTPQIQKRSHANTDAQTAGELWRLSEKLTGVAFPMLPVVR